MKFILLAFNVIADIYVHSFLTLFLFTIYFIKSNLFFFLPASYSVPSSCSVWLFATPWTTAYQASLSVTNSRSPPKPMSIVSMMPSNHLILCRPLLLLPSIFPSIRVFSNVSAVCIRWLRYWSFSTSLSKEYSGLTSCKIDWFDLLIYLCYL